MKPAGLHLLFLVLAGVVSAQEPAATPSPTKTSARLKQEISAALPKFTPPPPREPGLPTAAEMDPDPNVLALPKVTVKEYRPPTHDPDVWLTDKAIGQKAMAAYKQSLSDFEWALNSWYIPLFGSPPSARARAAYRANKSMADIQRVHRLFNLVSARNPKDAAELERERVKMDQAEYWQSRPAGHGRSK